MEGAGEGFGVSPKKLDQLKVEDKRARTEAERGLEWHEKDTRKSRLSGY